MPPTLTKTRPGMAYEPAPGLKRWTRKEARNLVKIGFLTDRYELVEGVLISKIGQNRPHMNAVMWLTEWIRAVFGAGRVQTQGPIDVSPEDIPTSEPEPDVSALKSSLETFSENNPRPEDILLLIEVADTTLKFDRTIKAGLYARAGITEYWIVDLKGRRVLVHREPEKGVYRTLQAYAEDETLSPLAQPETSVVVRELLPAKKSKGTQ